MRLKLLVWRQAGPEAPGKMVPYTAEDISPDMSFLEMLDVVNEDLIRRGEEPIAFDSDCREASAARAAWWSTAGRTAPTAARPSVSCTCGGSRTVTR